jgi:hypothetical protein
MRTRFILAAAVLCLGAAAGRPAHAVGCLSGGLAGAVAGHMVHHGVLGAVGGCIAGHEMKKHQQRAAMMPRQNPYQQQTPRGVYQ